MRLHVTAEILAEVRRILLALKGMSIDSLLSTRLIQAFKEEGRFEGIVSWFQNGDPVVVGCNIKVFQALMEKEGLLMNFINPLAGAPAAK
jgi:signal transduction histidine kinase